MNPNYQKMMKQVQKMQADMAKVQEDLANETVEASAGGGMVTVQVTGAIEIKSIKIDPDGGRPGRRGDARGHDHGRHQRGSCARRRNWPTRRLGGITSGLNIPGLPF